MREAYLANNMLVKHIKHRTQAGFMLRLFLHAFGKRGRRISKLPNLVKRSCSLIRTYLNLKVFDASFVMQDFVC